MKKIVCVIFMLVLGTILVSGCLGEDKPNIYEGDPLVGYWEIGGLTVDVRADGTGDLAYKGLSTGFDWKRIDNDTVELNHFLLGTHQITYDIISENEIYLTYEGNTYHIEKVE